MFGISKLARLVENRRAANRKTNKQIADEIEM
jgi:hypothetical protein